MFADKDRTANTDAGYRSRDVRSRELFVILTGDRLRGETAARYFQIQSVIAAIHCRTDTGLGKGQSEP